MTKQQFVKLMTAMQEQMDEIVKKSEILSSAFTEAQPADFMPASYPLLDTLQDYLKGVMNDECDWIGYYMWELDFGRENYRLKVTENGREIPLSTPEELYALLIRTRKNDNIKEIFLFRSLKGFRESAYLIKVTEDNIRLILNDKEYRNRVMKWLQESLMPSFTLKTRGR